MKPLYLRRNLLRDLTACAAIVAWPSSSIAQSYPNRPVRLVVGFAPGGATDLVARALGNQLAEQLGQPFVVDNRGGAGGNIGANAVAKAAPDGYTLLLATVGTLSINPTLYTDLPFNPTSDFAPISRLTTVPQILVINPSLPAHDLGEFIAYAKAQGTRLNFASGGVGTATHLAGEMFNSMAGIKMGHIPYKSTSLAMVDVLAGRVPVIFDQIATSMPLVNAGQLRALGVTTSARSPIAPDLPTISEAGLSGYDVFTWHALLSSAGTPRPVVDRLNAEVARALEAPAIRRVFDDNGIVSSVSTPEALADLIKTELARWREIVKATGATLN